MWWLSRELADVSGASSGHLRRCSYAVTDSKLETWHLSFSTIVINYNGLLEAAYRHIRSITDIMVVECGAGGRPKH
eukprot:scaffold7209_cov113-Skeletonema_marinoi.AAC.1